MQGARLANLAAVALVACLGAIGGFAAWQILGAPPAQPQIVKLMPSKAPLPAAELIGTVATDFTLPDRQGNARRLSDWRGRVVLINFWATWCAPCREEMPMLERVYQQLRERGFTVVGVAIDELDAIDAFVDEIGVTFPVLVASSANLRLTQQFGNTLGALPYSVLVDPEGTIAYLKTGILDEAELTRAVEARF